jgi:hypothetical protein
MEHYDSRPTLPLTFAPCKRCTIHAPQVTQTDKVGGYGVPAVNGMSYGVVKKSPGKSAEAMRPALGSLSEKSKMIPRKTRPQKKYKKSPRKNFCCFHQHFP